MTSRPTCIVVVADDITGAAEMAGIAHRRGLRTQLLMWSDAALEMGHNTPLTADVLVIATDTRSGSVDEAIQTTQAVAGYIQRLAAGQQALQLPPSVHDTEGHCPQAFPLPVFKKTDSALRGHIAAETTALMAALGYPHALLLAQNPSRGRVIAADGTYYVGDLPLAESAFRYDPEFPATTSSAPTLVLSRYASASTGLRIAPATTVDEVVSEVRAADSDTLVAGAADCFEAYINKAWPQDPSSGMSAQTAPQVVSQPSKPHAQVSQLMPQGSWIIVCGSTQSRSLASEPFIQALGAEEISMTDEAFHGGSPQPWLRSLQASYLAHGSVVLAVGHPSTGGREYAVRLRSLMAEAVTRLVGTRQPDYIVIEGGATAFALLGRLGWQSFQVSAELGPGIVRMTYTPAGGSHHSVHIISKPGSYPWGNLFDGSR